MSIEEITSMVREMENETKAIKLQLFRLCWFMRGGMTIEQAYLTDNEDREVIDKLIESNLETTRETKLPFF